MKKRKFLKLIKSYGFREVRNKKHTLFMNSNGDRFSFESNHDIVGSNSVRRFYKMIGVRPRSLNN